MTNSGILKNNFNLIRLLAAIQVLIVHACNHFEYNSIFIKALKCFPGVPLFFFISGYLIGGTYIKNHQKGLITFFRNRILRLYPAIIVCTVLSVIAVYCTGYFGTVSFTPEKFLFWIMGQITFYQFYNPDFMRGYGIGVLNGSLWTIAVELQFYILTPLIFYLFKKWRFVLILFFLMSLSVNIYLRFYLNWDLMFMKLLSVSFIPWVFMFLMGYFFAYYKEYKQMVYRINIFLLLGIYILSMNIIGSYYHNAMNSINPISAFVLGLLVLKFSELKIKMPRLIEKFIEDTDLSYGIYIYHMPVINTLIYLHLFNKSTNIILTIVVTIIFGYLSWIFVERRTLKLKK